MIPSSTGARGTEVSLAEKRQETRRTHDGVVTTTCALCPAGCGMRLATRAGGVVDVWGEAEHPLSKGSLCALGSAVGQLVSSPARLTEPRARLRRGEPWRTISWDEALGLCATRLAPFREAGRGQAVALAQGRAVPLGSLLSARRLGGALGLGSAPAPAPEGTRALGALASMVPAPDWTRAGSILLVAADPASSEPCTMGWIVDARLRGARVITVDGRRTRTTLKSDLVVPARPGSERLVLAGLGAALVRRGRHDEAMARAALRDAEGWLARCAALDLGAVSRASGVSETQLEEVAAALAESFPALVVVDPDALGGEAAGVLGTAVGLLALLGALGLPGGGLACLGGPLPPLDAGLDPAREPVAATNPPAVLLWEASCPPRRRDSWAAAVAERAGYVVALAAFPDAVTEVADLVLPAALWLEHGDVILRSTSRCLQWHRTVVPPPGRARSGAWIWAALARTMGVGALFPWLGPELDLDEGALTDFFLSHSPAVSGCSRALLDPATAGPGGILWPAADGEATRLEHGAVIRGRWRLLDRRAGWPGPEEPVLTVGFAAEDASADLAGEAGPRGSTDLLEEMAPLARMPGGWPLVGALMP
ncbi:MAG: molybdopterin-dependent oxidoreductase [Candidatus Rokubacteria bacterium]|nr:molybdopterin-dependent oxidoreductase [Candidatus Rokubacteria bacterium]MBI3107933.1 molybdopterin-dependent oxidoreductase [Candidatus Rokubacteria bacterium]